MPENRVGRRGKHFHRPGWRMENLSWKHPSSTASWAAWGQQDRCSVEFSHGWVCWAALLLEMLSIAKGLFLASRSGWPVARWRSGGESPAVTLDVQPCMRFGLSLALALPEPCCQSAKPASHAGRAPREPIRSSSAPARDHRPWARQWLWG